MVNVSRTQSRDPLARILEDQVLESESSSWEVSEQRERNHRYYALDPLGNEIKGRSHYISPDVLDVVEGKKAIFAETFLSSRDVVRFTECPYPGEAAQKTAYVNKTFKRNQYQRLFRDGWHDAFVAKRMVVLVDWHEATKEQTLQLQNAMGPMVTQQLQQTPGLKDVDDSQIQVGYQNTVQGPVPVLNGELTLVLDDSHTKLKLIQPERYFRDPNVAYGDEGMWQTVEEELSRGYLISRNYDRDQIMGLPSEYKFRREQEDAARKKNTQSWRQGRTTSRVDAQETLAFYRTYTWLDNFDGTTFEGLDLDFEPSEGFELYEIHWCQGEILRWAPETPEQEAAEGEDPNAPPKPGYHAVKRVPETGIFEWSEMKISHAENGMCTADVVAHNQKTTSSLKRLIIDNQQMVNTSRTLALSNGGIKNPRDLLDNSIGATIWAKRPDAVSQLPTPMLSPLTMDVLAMMTADKDDRGGLSGLAKGMNTDAIKYQNADNMIDRLTTAGQRRVTMACRDFATTWLIPVSQYIVHLAMRNDKGQMPMEVAGQQVMISPQQWQDEDLAMDVAVALTSDEGQRMAQQLLMLNQMIAQDPQMALSYGAVQKHAMYDMIFDMLGITDTTALMLSPKDPQYGQMAQQQAQAAQAAAAKQDQLMQVQMGLGAAQAESLKANTMLGFKKFSWDQTNDMADNMREDQKLALDKVVKIGGLKVDMKEAQQSGQA
jgi:hypothetical protein